MLCCGMRCVVLYCIEVFDIKVRSVLEVSLKNKNPTLRMWGETKYPWGLGLHRYFCLRAQRARPFVRGVNGGGFCLARVSNL